MKKLIFDSKAIEEFEKIRNAYVSDYNEALMVSSAMLTDEEAEELVDIFNLFLAKCEGIYHKQFNILKEAMLRDYIIDKFGEDYGIPSDLSLYKIHEDITSNNVDPVIANIFRNNHEVAEYIGYLLDTCFEMCDSLEIMDIVEELGYDR